MFRVVGWNFNNTRCHLCGNFTKTDVVVDLDKDYYDSFDACLDCTKNKVESDGIAQAFERALKNLVFLKCDDCMKEWVLNINDPSISDGCPKCGSQDFKKL